MSAYRDSLPADARARYDAVIAGAARVCARWCLDDASGEAADGEKAA